MNRMVKILMERDGLTKEEAKQEIANTKEEILEAIEQGDYSLAEDILAWDLGLEPDYILDMFL